MNRKTISGITLTLLVASLLTWASNVQLFSIGGTVYSRVTPEEVDVDWWHMFHHDLSHTGYSTSTAPNTNHTVWNYTTGSYVESSPAVADGKVYIGSYDMVYCLNASTGAKIWDYTTGDLVWSSPAVADGKVYVGSGDNKVYAFGEVHDVAVTNITLLRNGLHRGFCIGKPEINVTVENHGNFPENLNVTCTGTKDLTIVTIGVQAVALNPGQSTTIQFDWNATGIPPGNYTISAAAPLAGDINPGDNSLIDGVIGVMLEGDITGEGVVELDDLISLIYSWGSIPGHQKWNVYADIDCTNVVELDDLLILIYYWGSHW